MAAGDDVFVEAQLAAGPDHAVKLGERAVLVGDRAEDEAGDRGVDDALVKWHVVSDAGHHAHWHRRAHRRLGGAGSERRLGLDRDDLGDLGRVVREVEPVTGSDLDPAPYLDYLRTKFAA